MYGIEFRHCKNDNKKPNKIFYSPEFFRHAEEEKNFLHSKQSWDY